MAKTDKKDKVVANVAEQASGQQEIDSRRSKTADDVREKMTIYDYEQRYVKRENVRGAKWLLRITATIIGVFLFVLLFLVALKVWEINEYVGYAVGAACLLVYIFAFIVPLVKVMCSGYFITNVNAYSARKAQKHNKALRHEIAKKIIDLTAKVDGVGWYDSQTVGKLAIALHANDEEGIKLNLTALYTGSVKKSAKDLIFKSSLKSAMYSALAQTAKVDSALVVFVNMQLIKDLVFLYGFRPSDAKLAKIFVAVIRNSLIAYGLGSMQIGNTVVRTMGEAVKGIPILGSAIATLVDSSVQGLTNGTLTTVIGYQTIKYMTEEYKLQNVLDGIEIAETQEEFAEACAELEKELKKEQRRGKRLATA